MQSILWQISSPLWQRFQRPKRKAALRAAEARRNGRGSSRGCCRYWPRSGGGGGHHREAGQ